MDDYAFEGNNVVAYFSLAPHEVRRATLPNRLSRGAPDSIPAILAITDDPFIVYTSNVFAILGLRSLYFALSGIQNYFHYLKYGLASILAFVGVKMCIVDFYKIPVDVSLIVIVSILIVAVITSLVFPKKQDSAVAE